MEDLQFKLEEEEITLGDELQVFSKTPDFCIIGIGSVE